MTTSFSPVKVRRLSDGKIFTNSDAVAKAYKLSISRQVEGSCNGYIGIVEGSLWEWSYNEVPEPDFGDYSELEERARNLLPKEDIQKRSSHYRAYGKARDPKYRQKMLPIVQFMRSFVNDPRQDQYLSTKDFHHKFLAYTVEKRISDTIFSLPAFAKHLKSWEDLYRKLVGMEISYGRDLRSRKIQMLSFDSSKVDPFSSVFDEVEEYALETAETIRADKKLKSFKNAIPVYCFNTGKAYPSLKVASQKTYVPPNEIRYICNGDYPCYKAGNIEWKFRYAKWKEVSEKWLISKNTGTFSNSPIPIVNLLTGESYRSISEASKLTGVPRSKIVRSMSLPEGENIIRINRLETGEAKFAFGVLSEEETW